MEKSCLTGYKGVLPIEQVSIVHERMCVDMAITQQQAIKKLVRSLTMTTKTGEAALDVALKQFGYTSFQALKNRLNKDRSNFYSGYWSSTTIGEKFLMDYCGIRLNNKDVGAITSSDAGGSIEKTAASIVAESTAAAKLSAAQYKSFTKNGLKVNITYADTYNSYFFDDDASFLNKQKLIVRNLYSWWIGDALKLVNDSLGVNFTDGRASVKELNVVFKDDYYGKPVTLSAQTDMGRASNLTLTINMRNYAKLKSGDKNGASDDNTAVYLDRQIADALAEAALAANVNYFYDLPDYVQTGLIGLVTGLDDRSKSQLSENASSSLDFNYLDGQADGYILLRYLAKQVAKKTGASSVSYNLDKTGVSIEGPFQGTWDGAKYAATVKKIDASKDTKKIIIKGNKQANTILAGSGGSEIYGGKGNDIIYGGSGKDVFNYASGDGNDVIGSYASGKDMIRITSGKLNKATVSGNDVVLQVGSGRITIKNGKGKKLSIAMGKKAAAKTYTYGSSVKTQQAVILQFVESLASTQKTGEAAMDEALKQFGYTSFQALKNRLNKDRSNFYSGYWSSTTIGEKFLMDYCGIRLNNKDVGAITSSDAGGSIEKTAASIVAESTAAAKLSAAQYKSFTKNGLKVNITYADTYNSYFFDDDASFLNKQKLIVRNLYSWWIGDALKLVNDSLGVNFTDGRASVKELNVVFKDDYYGKPVTLSAQTDMGRASNLTLTINMRNYAKLKSGDKNGASDDNTAVYLDRQIADALAEAALAANVNYFYDLPDYVQTGLIGLVTGLDDRSKSQLSENASSSLDFNYLDGQADGYILLRYLARQAARSTLPANLTNTGDGQTVTAKAGFKGTFNAGEYSSTVKTINVSAAKKAVTIKGNNNANVIRAGLGGGNYYGMKGTDTLYGNNKAKDTFWYGKGDGNDTIYDYKSGQDTIRLSSGTLLRSSVSGRNVILDMGSGKITIAGAKGKKITLIDAKGKKTTKVYGQGSLLAKGVSVNAKNTAMTLKAPFTGTVNAADYTDTIKSIDAGKAGKVTLQGGTTNIKLIGSAKADVLKAGKGGATLDGGKGSDKLYGGAGKDKFIFRKGYGTDTVFGSAKGDIAYLYNINNIKQVKKFSLKKGVLSLSFTNSKDVFTVNGWSAGGMNTFVLSNGAKYQLKASGSKVTAKRI